MTREEYLRRKEIVKAAYENGEIEQDTMSLIMLENCENSIIENALEREYISKDLAFNLLRVKELEKMPFDKAFETESGNEELCHATGYKVCFGNLNDTADWWNEYEDSDGNLHYGR